MLFGHPSMQSHMQAGVRKALASTKTPAHLRPHLQKRLTQGAAVKPAPATRLPKQVDPDAYDDLQDVATSGNDDPQTIGDLQDLRPAVRPLGRTASPRAMPVKMPMKKKIAKPKGYMKQPGGINKEMFFGRG